MLNRYRWRFVAVNMSLIALVLALTLMMQGIHIYRSEYNDLRKTMALILEPWRYADADFRPQWDQADWPPKEEAPVLDQDAVGDEQIVTVFYNRDSGALSLLPLAQSCDRDAVSRAAMDAAQRTEEFGLLPEHRMFYTKQGSDSVVKIVLADASFLDSRVRRSVLMLLGVYALALGLLFLISLWLSKLAARPMERAMEMERQFVADISHDLKTPITVVLANDSILKDSPDATVGEQMQWIDSTGDAARGMMHLVEQMLTLSGLEAAERTVEKHPVSLSALAEKSVLQFESLAYDRGVTLEDDMEEGVSVLADEDGCMRILNGLIENALKYEPPGGSVRLELRREKKKAVLTVANPGSRIAPEDLGHIFERFYRADKTRGDHGGHGLGLPIVKQLCDSLGAEIKVRSDEDEGTVFTVSFDTV